MNTKEEIMGSEIVLVTNGGMMPLKVDAYPDGTPLINQWGIGEVDRILLRPKTIQAFMATMWFVDAIKERGQLVPQPPPPIQQESDSLLDLPDFVVANPSSNHDAIHLVEPVRTEIKSTPWPAAAVPVQLSLFG